MALPAVRVDECQTVLSRRVLEVHVSGSSARRATTSADRAPGGARRSARSDEHARLPVQRLHDDGIRRPVLIQRANGTRRAEHLDEDDCLAVRRPGGSRPATRRQSPQTAAVSADDPDPALVDEPEREQLAVGRERPVGDGIPHQPPQARAVGPRNVERTSVTSLGSRKVRDRASVARDGHRREPAAAREQGCQARAVRPDAVRAIDAVAVAGEQKPVDRSRWPAWARPRPRGRRARRRRAGARRALRRTLVAVIPAMPPSLLSVTRQVNGWKMGA